jgi:DtxR family Mn-dependent transcriptional regulator
MEHGSITAEDYLKIIDELTNYRGHATLNDISKFFSVTRQSVYDEMNILIERGMVERTSKGEYVLSEKGKHEANIFLRKHRIAEILLSRALKMRWDLLDSEAMGIEHGITETIASLVCETYGCEKCPHGNPVPDVSGNVTEPNDLSLQEIAKNSRVRVSRVIFESDEVLRYLQSNSITPGSDLVVGEDGGVYFYQDGGRSRIPEDIASAMKFFPQ